MQRVALDGDCMYNTFKRVVGHPEYPVDALRLVTAFDVVETPQQCRVPNDTLMDALNGNWGCECAHNNHMYNTFNFVI